MMTPTPDATVLAWLAAVNSRDNEAALALTAADVAIVGPRGTGRGREVLREWLNHAGATFETRAVFARDGAVVVAQHGVWRAAGSDTVTGSAVVATRFRVANGRVCEIQRYDEIDLALAEAGLSQADARSTS